MLERIEVTAKGFHLSEIEKNHIEIRVGDLGKYIPRHARRSAHAEVVVKQGSVKGKIAYMTEIVLHLPKSVLAAQGASSSVEESVDLAEGKLKAQVVKYKSRRVSISSIRHKFSKQKKSQPVVQVAEDLE